MPRRIRIYPYKQGSQSASRLATALGGRVLKLVGSGFTAKPNDVIINWGSSACPFPQALNKPEAIARAANKLLAFNALAAAGVSVPRFAASSENVPWEGMTVVRHKLTGHSGEGIELVEPGQTLPSAPLYVEYKPKKDEYRVHVMGTSIIVVQRKARRLETPDSDVNWKVRNHSNGFNFVRSDVNPPQAVLDEAVKAVAALGLDFGAADIIYNTKEQRAYVLEVNTACGLEGQTITDYATAFAGLLNS